MCTVKTSCGILVSIGSVILISYYTFFLKNSSVPKRNSIQYFCFNFNLNKKQNFFKILLLFDRAVQFIFGNYKFCKQKLNLRSFSVHDLYYFVFS